MRAKLLEARPKFFSRRFIALRMFSLFDDGRGLPFGILRHGKCFRDVDE